MKLEDVLSMPEMCKLLRKGRPTVLRWVDAGMPYLKLGGKNSHWAFSRKDVEQWIGSKNGGG